MKIQKTKQLTTNPQKTVLVAIALCLCISSFAGNEKEKGDYWIKEARRYGAMSKEFTEKQARFEKEYARLSHLAKDYDRAGNEHARDSVRKLQYDIGNELLSVCRQRTECLKQCTGAYNRAAALLTEEAKRRPTNM